MRVHEISNIVIFGVHNSQSYGSLEALVCQRKKFVLTSVK